MAHLLACRLLGVFHVIADDRPVEDAAWRRNRAKALVKLLALAPGHRLHRERLCEALWPELGNEAAAVNFRKALHFARQALGPGHLVVRDAMVSLEAADLWVDVVAFDQAVDSGDLAGAIALYGGDLLMEDRFEPWTEPRREQLRVRHGQVLLDWSRELVRRGDLRRATSTLEQLTELDPLHEEAHTELMRVLARSGKRRLALQTYDRLAARLDAELGVAPGRPVRQVWETILAGSLRAEPRPAPVPGTAGEPVAATTLPEERRLVTVVALAGATASAVAEVLEGSGTATMRPRPDGLLVVFGAPTAGENDALDALQVTLELTRRLPGAVRAGIETGEAVIDAGTAARIEGDPLDVAIRLRETAPPGVAVAGPVAYRLARGTFSFTRQESGGTAPAWRLRGACTDAAGRRPSHSPFVGRSAELDTLVSLCTQTAAGGRPRSVTVVGVAGVGKSRLVAETVARMAPEYTVLRGRCLPRGQTGVYAPLSDLLRDASGVDVDRGAGSPGTRLQMGLADLLAPLGAASDVDRTTIAALAMTAGIEVAGDNPLDGLAPADVAEEMGRAWPRFATACAMAGPVLLVLEDLHWAAPELLEMLERMIGRCTGPVVLIGTARPELLESHPAYGSRPEGSALITLAPLTDVDGRHLLADLRTRGAVDLSDQSAAEVLARAEGNPFFLEELVAHVVDGTPAEGLPYSLRAVLAARIDALPPLDRRVLQEASVVGRRFWRQPVEQSLELTDVGRPLQALETRGLVLVQPSSSLAGQTEYAFKHALVREAAYASLTRAHRARAHAAIGSWLEGVLSDQGDERSELLAYHFREAADPRYAELVWDDPTERERIRELAFTYLLAAGSAASRRFALASAIDLHDAALGLARHAEERLRAVEILGDDHGLAYRGKESNGYLQEALDAVRADPARAADRARLCWKLAWGMAMTPGAYRTSPDPQTVEDLVSEGLAAEPDDRTRARLLLTRATSARLWRGSEPFGQGERLDPAPIELRIGAVDEAMAIAAAAGDEELARAGRFTLGVLYGMAGRYAEMVDLAYVGVSTLEQLRSRLEQADALRTLAVVTGSVAGRFAESLEHARGSRALAIDANPHQIMHATYAILVALFQLGRWDEMDEVLDEHLRALDSDPAVSCQFVRDGPVVAAIALRCRGEWERAAALTDLVGDPRSDVDNASAYQARYATASGDPSTARTISETKATEGRFYGPQHALALVEAMQAQQDWAALAAFLPFARTQCAGNALLEPFCDRAEGLVHAASGRHRTAKKRLDRALATFERMAIRFEADRTRVAAEEL